MIRSCFGALRNCKGQNIANQTEAEGKKMGVIEFISIIIRGPQTVKNCKFLDYNPVFCIPLL
jgi:hypothetical protein